MGGLSFFERVWVILLAYWPSILLGVRTTLIVSLSGTAIGLCIGLLIGGLKAVKLDYTASKPIKIIKKIFDILSTVYIEVFRGTPMMVQAVFIYYALLNVIHWDNITAAIFVISINTGSYMSEIIRSGIQSIDAGQVEASRSLGMSNIQTMMNVVLPQAIRNAFPAIGNELIVNIKDSSVLMIISITDLMFQSKSIAGSTFWFTETYFLTAAVYLFLTTISSIILHYIERRMHRSVSSIPTSDTDPSNQKLQGE